MSIFHWLIVIVALASPIMGIVRGVKNSSILNAILSAFIPIYGLVTFSQARARLDVLPFSGAARASRRKGVLGGPGLHGPRGTMPADGNLAMWASAVTTCHRRLYRKLPDAPWLGTWGKFGRCRKFLLNLKDTGRPEPSG